MPPKAVPAPKTDSASSTAARDSSENAPASTDTSDASDLDRLAQMVEGLGPIDGFYAKLDRLRRPGLAEQLSGYIGTMDFTGPDFLDDVAETHGGGKFRARIFNERGKYRASLTFTVAGAPKRPDVGNIAAASGGAPSASSDSHSRLERMIEGLTASIAGVVELVKAQNQPKGHSLGEVIEIAKVLKELAPATPPATSTKEMLETIETVMDIRERMGESMPRGGHQSDFASIAEHGVRPLVSLGERYLSIQERAMDMRARGQLPPARSAKTGDGIAPITSAASTSPAAAPPAEAVDLVVELARSIPRGARLFLRAHADANRDTETYAIMALDTIQASNPETFATLPALLELPDFTPRLLACVPEWQPRSEWFAAMFADMKQQLDEDIGPGDAGDAGDVGDQPGDRAA